MLAVLVALAFPVSAAALDGGHGAWVPGALLVRFNDGVSAPARARIAARDGVTLRYRLPLVPNLWEATTDGRVPAATGALERSRAVDYAQPDYLDQVSLDASPSQAAYWPNDPYFWPLKWSNENGCRLEPPSSRDVLSGWPYWPQGGNLTDPAAVLGRSFNPLAQDEQAVRAGGDPAYAIYHPIDVLPVWNLLAGQGRLGTGRTTSSPGSPWTANAMQQFGVAVMDTGISNAPDVAGQLAAEFSVVTAKQGKSKKEQISEVFTDNPARHDLQAVEAVLPERHTPRTFERANRQLFTLDDTDEHSPRDWSPTRGPGQELLPGGCDGHGTQVASVAGATANNKLGTAGVGYNVPLVGLRTGMPWDVGGVAYANDGHLATALTQWRDWSKTAEESESDQIDQLGIVAALRIPVLNMSFGTPMLTRGTETSVETVNGVKQPVQTERPVLIRPGVVEALAKLLSNGQTLGIAAAGNTAQNYGSGSGARGVQLRGQHGIQEPCGIPLIPKLGVYRTPNADAQHVIATAPYVPTMGLNALQLLCVAAGTPRASQLWTESGRGDAAVQLAAPGTNVTVADRPGTAPEPSQAYTNVSGTSVAAPMVAGAASLLRRAAPAAPIATIRAALLNGARRSAELAGQVSYGSLDVGCSLRWLAARTKPGWDMVPLVHELDPAAYDDLTAATAGCQRLPVVRVSSWSRPTSEIYSSTAYGSLNAAITAQELKASPSNSTRWSELILQGAGFKQPAYRPALSVGSPPFPTPVNPATRAGPVHEVGRKTIACPTDYAITAMKVTFANLISPKGWALPTDAGKPTSTLDVAVFVNKPWYHALIGGHLDLVLKARCEYFPTVTR
ncbi:MAG: S8 family serine peptidase [Solirubrobacteraceae bacterium]